MSRDARGWTGLVGGLQALPLPVERGVVGQHEGAEAGVSAAYAVFMSANVNANASIQPQLNQLLPQTRIDAALRQQLLRGVRVSPGAPQGCVARVGTSRRTCAATLSSRLCSLSVCTWHHPKP